MSVFRTTPYAGLNFLVDLGDGNDTGPESGVAEVIFPEARVHTFEYRNGNEKENAARKVQAITRYGNLILKRGATGALNWYQWWNEIRNGAVADERSLSVKLLNENRSGVVMVWKFLRARPVNHQFSPLNAVEGQPLVETLEVAFERIEME